MNSGRCLQAKVATCAGAAGFLEAGEGVKGPGPWLMWGDFPYLSHPTVNSQITAHYTPMDQSNKLSTTAPTCAGTNTTNLATTCMLVRRTCQVLVVVYHTTKFADVITCWY